MLNLDKTFKLFYKKKSEGQGFPKFQSSRDNEQSFVIRNQSTHWSSTHLKIFRESIKWVYHRDFPDDAKFNGGVIKRESDGKYYAIMNLTFNVEEQESESTLSCGIDLNVNNLAISSSDGTSSLIKLKDFSKSKYSKHFRKLQQQLSRRHLKKNFSQNTKRLQTKANKIQRKIKNQKEDQFHKISNDLTNKFGSITMENLKIKDMKESTMTHLNRLLTDVSLGALTPKIKYKSEMKNKFFREIDPAYTSQRCSTCGHIHKDNRKTQSSFLCTKCGFQWNADLNASHNILYYDQWSLVQKTLISTWESKSLLVQA